MTTKNTGGHAFPTQAWDYDVARVLQYQEPGMSLRDWFAGLAMQGYFAAPYTTHQVDADDVARYCYAMADAMLKQREVRS